MAEKVVQGFMYDNEGTEEHKQHNQTICQIIGKGDANDYELMEYGPAFLVKFGNGDVITAFARELHPYYPT